MDKNKEKQLVEEAKVETPPKRGKKMLYLDLELYANFKDKCEKKGVKGVSRMIEVLMKDFVK